ncbi:YqaA family protein [Jannaschia sp. W003]|uniref:YqaA family protein n=1 Tax=Jannaschia sp. W003 TaxID=2867012 RepID=UPI0021A460A3|nr:YqaA family protein [Jannaschia sp. W003]UWQ20252.1 DedA family protein [Jannaschia sp. W003]
MIRRLYDWTIGWAAHPRALWVLAVVSFLESSFFPIPPDVLLLPMVLARPSRAWVIAGVCTAASVAGALLGYAIGYFAYEGLGAPMLAALGKAAYFEEFQLRFNEWGAWVVLAAGVTPFPYKVITILSGATALSLPVFVVASIVARGLRFFLVAGILWAVGDPARAFIERRLGLVFTAAVVLLFGGLAAVRFL